jgi:SAM-dependent methyltransferase
MGKWTELQDYQISFLKKMGLRPHHHLLDIGCGPISGGLVTIPYLETGHYVGIDIRKKAIAEALVQVSKNKLILKEPSLYVSTTFGADELGERQFDYIWASQILYHIPKTLIDTLFLQIARRLKPGGRFYGDVIEYPGFRDGMSWHEFPFIAHSPDTLHEVACRAGLALAYIGKLEEFGYPNDVDLKLNDMLELRLK